MKSVSTMFRTIDSMNEMLEEPKWVIGFLYFQLDSQDSVKLDLDLGELMLHFGFTEEFELCNSYYLKYPDSIAMPMSQGIDNFFQHLRDIGIYKQTDNPYDLQQTDNCKEIYGKIMDGYRPEVNLSIPASFNGLPTI